MLQNITDLDSYFKNSRVLAQELSEARRNIIYMLSANYSTYLRTADFENIFQDTCEAVWENYLCGKLTYLDSLQKYMMGVANNKTLKMIERDKHVKLDVSFKMSKDPENPGIDEGQIAKILGLFPDDCDKEECFSAISSAVESLREKCKKILQYFYYDNFSMETIAKLMGYNTTVVARNRKHKCLEQLIDKYKEPLKEVCQR